MSSEYFKVQSIVFLYFHFDCNSPSRRTTAAIVLFSLVSTEPVPDMKNISEIENQLLHKTAPVLKSSVHEKKVAGHCPRYFRANTMLQAEVDISKTFHLQKFLAYF